MTATIKRARAGSGAMFDRIADRYDLLNRVLSLGVDHRWRRALVDSLELKTGGSVLDLATGTGDVALRVLEVDPLATVTGLDPSARMLALAEEKVARAAAADRVRFVGGDAQALPFVDDAFDGVTMAFGIRNVPDRDRALREMARVTRPGGRVSILELSEPRGLLGPLARFHVHVLVPWIGALLSGDREYRYLAESIAAFPAPGDFAAQMEAAGLPVVKVEALTFGACALLVAELPAEEGA